MRVPPQWNFNPNIPCFLINTCQGAYLALEPPITLSDAGKSPSLCSGIVGLKDAQCQGPSSILEYGESGWPILNWEVILDADKVTNVNN